jgi:hypothetical protein
MVLNAVRLKGMVDAPAVADMTSLPQRDVDQLLDDLAGVGAVANRPGPVVRWALTPVGREEHARLLAIDVEAVRAAGALHDGYETFRRLNAELLAVCTAWQLRRVGSAQMPNDHLDEAYDRRVVERLSRFHTRASRLCMQLGGVLERLVPYDARLGRALDRVRAGAKEWFASPAVASYHSVWFELHEDLLAALGIPRATEEARDAPS